MGFCPKLNLYWHNKHNGLQMFYEYNEHLFSIFDFVDIFKVFIIGNIYFSFIEIWLGKMTSDFFSSSL